MNPLFQKVIKAAIKWNHGKNSVKEDSKYDVAKRIYKLKISSIQLLNDSFLIILGIISAGFGLKGFLIPNAFIDGGVTGISLLVNELTEYPLSILIVVLNIPFIVIGYPQIGKLFAIKS